MADETETLEIDNAELSTTEDTIKSNTQTAVAETLDLDKQKILEKIRKAQNAEKRVKLFAKLTDKYGLEAIVGIIPGLGDATTSTISTCYLLAEGIRIGLPRRRCLQILGYQVADAAIGWTSVLGDIADVLFKGNKYSAKIFSKHLEKLKKAAIKQGISQEEIDNIGKKEEKFIKTMDKYVDYESKKKRNLSKKIN